MKTNYAFLRRLLPVLFLTMPFAALAQTGVTIGALTAPDASAALDIISTTKGVLLPRVASTAKGLLVYQTGAPAGCSSPPWAARATTWATTSLPRT